MGADSDRKKPLQRLRDIAEERKWYKNEFTFKWLSAASTALGMLGVLAAAITYLWETYSNAELQIDTPLVVELRCSETEFNRELCWDANVTPPRTFTVTAALRLEAKGPKKQSIAIDRGKLTFSVGKLPGEVKDTTFELQAFWSVNMSPGQAGQRRQIVPISLAGGDAVSQEIWFVPVPRLCMNAKSKTCDERADFAHWFHFINTVVKPRLAEAGKRPELANGATIEFEFYGRRGGEAESSPVKRTCTVEFGQSARLMVDSNEKKPLVLTLPCREAFASARS